MPHNSTAQFWRRAVSHMEPKWRQGSKGGTVTCSIATHIVFSLNSRLECALGTFWRWHCEKLKLCFLGQNVESGATNTFKCCKSPKAKLSQFVSLRLKTAKPICKCKLNHVWGLWWTSCKGHTGNQWLRNFWVKSLFWKVTLLCTERSNWK